MQKQLARIYASHPEWLASIFMEAGIVLRATGLAVIALSFGCISSAQTINTSCTLYPGAAYCTSADTGANIAQQRQQQYQTGQAVGSGIGMAIFRAHFPGWRRKYCAQHPEQPFHYGNARGDSISGTCPSLQVLSKEAAAEFVGRHPGSVKSSQHANAIDSYIATNHLAPWDPKSYEKAAKETANQSTGTLPATEPATVPAQPENLFVWFDEGRPTPGAPLFQVLVTVRAYDGVLGIIREARKGNTSVQSGLSVIDTDFHPPTVNLDSWRNANPKCSPSLFYWQNENVSDTTLVMDVQMTKRAYEQVLASTAGSDLRVRPSRP
jgi:hypothetical protein